MRLGAGALLAAASATAYGSLGVFAKIAYAEGWNVPSLLTSRFLIAGLAILPFALLAGGPWRGFGRGVLVGAIGYAGTTALYFPSIQLVPAALAAFLLYLAPPFVAILSWLLLRERLGARGVGAIAVALGGLALMTLGAARGHTSLLGIALGAAAGLVFACTIVASRRLVVDLAWQRSTLAVCTGAFLTYLTFSLATGRLEVPTHGVGLGVSLAIGLVATAVPMSLMMAALARIGASRTAVISTLEPVSTLALEAAVLGVVPSVWGLTGGFLIAAAAAIVAWHAPEAAPREELP